MDSRVQISPPASSTDEAMPEISIVIPSLNEEKYIGKAMQGLRRQTFKDYEIIVVDNFSTDRTREIAKKYAKIIKDKRKGVGLARNIGARAAKGRILFFMDADTVASKNLLSEYEKAFSDERVVAATGPILPLEKTSSFIRLSYKFVSVLFVKLSIMFGRPSIVGSNFAVRRSAFERAGGFDEELLTYEDWNLSNKLKKYGKIRYLDGAFVHTSARRIFSWGVWGFFLYYMINMFKYHATKRPRTDYIPIR